MTDIERKIKKLMWEFEKENGCKPTHIDIPAEMRYTLLSNSSFIDTRDMVENSGHETILGLIVNDCDADEIRVFIPKHQKKAWMPPPENHILFGEDFEDLKKHSLEYLGAGSITPEEIDQVLSPEIINMLHLEYIQKNPLYPATVLFLNIPERYYEAICYYMGITDKFGRRMQEIHEILHYGSMVLKPTKDDKVTITAKD